MQNTFRHSLLLAGNRVLSIFGLKLIRQYEDFSEYIPFKKTTIDARKANLPINQYIDVAHNIPGATQETIHQMEKLGVFENKIERVCEIGPGSGRYLHHVIQKCHPDSYEIYETSLDWKKWLVQEYHVTAHEPDGNSLNQTQSKSVDLVHSHKVFPGLKIITVLRYFKEMVRVGRDGGVIVFDILTEDCLSDNYFEGWDKIQDPWLKTMMSKNFAITYFTSRGLRFAGSFKITMAPGITEYLVFKK